MKKVSVINQRDAAQIIGCVSSNVANIATREQWGSRCHGRCKMYKLADVCRYAKTSQVLALQQLGRGHIRISWP